MRPAKKQIPVLLFTFIATAVLFSCRLIYTVIPTPNDDPGFIQNEIGFRKSWDSLHTEVDKFIENNPGIKRMDDKDKERHRYYRTVCNKDTLFFSVWIGGNDSLSRLAVNFFTMQGVYFSDLDYNRERKAIKKNKAVYDSCQSCYEKIFLFPFIKEYVKNKPRFYYKLEYRALLLRFYEGVLN